MPVRAGTGPGAGGPRLVGGPRGGGVQGRAWARRGRKNSRREKRMGTQRR